MRFDLIDLKLFLSVHDGGSITAGARRQHMTLASASERIRGLEDRLGTPLLQRGPRGVVPTPAGFTLLHHARLVNAQVDLMQSDLAAYGHGSAGQVRLLSNTSAMVRYLPDALSRFLAAAPGVSVDVDERASHDIVDALRNGRADLGIVSDAADLDGLSCETLAPDPLELVVARGHPLAAHRQLSLVDVIDQPFIGLSDDSALAAHLAQQARRLGAHLHYRARLRSLEAVCQLVGRGIGIAIVPAAIARHAVRPAGIARITLRDTWAVRQLVMCSPMQGQPSPHALGLADVLRQVATAPLTAASTGRSRTSSNQPRNPR